MTIFAHTSTGNSQILLPRGHRNDATRGGAFRPVDDGLGERYDDQEILSNVPDRNHSVLSLPTEKGSEVLNLHKSDHRGAIVERRRGTQASGDHAGGDAPGPVKSERECQ